MLGIYSKNSYDLAKSNVDANLNKQNKIPKKNNNSNYKKEVDTNVLTFKFNFLNENVKLATGDLYHCNNCNSVFNKYSEIKEVSFDLNNKHIDKKLSNLQREVNKIIKKIWKCEFCLFENEINIEDEEKPVDECVDYFIENVLNSNLSNNETKLMNDKTIIFCFDVSGSMCVTEPVIGNYKIKGDYLNKYKDDLMKFSDGSSQFYNNYNKGKTYISRLQALQSGIESNLKLLSKKYPKLKVGIVTFNNEVICYGDCNSLNDITIVNGNNLNNDSEIIKAAEKSESLLIKTLDNNLDNLIKTIYSIEELGQTSLGPAILFSVHLIKNANRGSKIILCTDGMANIGLGNMEELVNLSKDNNKDFENLYMKTLENVKSFYSDLGEFAVSKGIIINLLTFEGEESNIEILGILCDKTGGEIERLKTTEVINNFSNLMENEVIATNVEISIKLPKFMTFRNEEQSNLSHYKSQLNKKIGNATNETELYCEYTVKSTKDLQDENINNLEDIKEAYFQTIVNYTNMEGNKCTRVITKKQILSTDKELINSQAIYDILCVNALKKCGDLAKKGDYKNTKCTSIAFNKMFNKNIANINNKEIIDNWTNKIKDLNENITNLEKSENNNNNKNNNDNNKSSKVMIRDDHHSKVIRTCFDLNSKKFLKK